MIMNSPEFKTAREALQHFYRGHGDLVVTLAARFFVTSYDEVVRMQAAGVEFTFVHPDEHLDGREVVVTVPAN